MQAVSNQRLLRLLRRKIFVVRIEEHWTIAFHDLFADLIAT